MLAVKHAEATRRRASPRCATSVPTRNDIGLAQAVEAGKIAGPRIIGAAYSFRRNRRAFYDSTFFPPSMDERSPHNADSPDAARRGARSCASTARR